MSLEYYFPPGIYPADQEPLRTDAGIRLSSSGYSRPRMRLSGVATNSPWTPWDSSEKASFNLYFAGEFGPGRLDYNLFTNYATREFQHLRLRAGKNDMLNPFITDELVRRMWLDMGHVGARGLFCPLYLNGIYRGLYNVCERYREPFFQAHYRSELSWDVNYIWTWVSGDNTAYQQLFTYLEKDLTNVSNWAAVTNRLDIFDAADYYLLNIYCAMWDWPQNNFCVYRERSSGPNSKFRFAVWDAEGAFFVFDYGKQVNYNTITNDLIVPSTHPSYWIDLSRIFRRLSTSPEFRLHFADRINYYMFNGGLLDDRDPDGAGPLKSRFKQFQDQLTREAGELVKYNRGQAMSLKAMDDWAATGTGRRSYLLGTTPGRMMFRESGFWPVTEPPMFSQFGGTVAPGFSLSMTSSVAVTGQTTTIYYTLTGSDPRVAGGGISSSSLTYTGAVTLSQLTTVKARARNNSTAEWSPLTQATFAPAAVPASSNNLVIAELMYHPPDATLAEVAAGYENADDFEFIRLASIGDTPVDLAGVRFTLGVTFDLTASPVRYLVPGASLLLVKNKAAFQRRYGSNFNASIAGEYAGNLSNGGERLQLVAADNSIIRDFIFGDAWPWPAAADGEGPSLVLSGPSGNPDPANAFNWTASALSGGTPGGVAWPLTYAAWQSLSWDLPYSTNNLVSGPQADPDGDGICNFLEYAFGTDPHRFNTLPQLAARLEDQDGTPSLLITVTLAAGAQSVSRTWESSQRLPTWSLESHIQLASTEYHPNGTATYTYVDTGAVGTNDQRYLRLRLLGPN